MRSYLKAAGWFGIVIGLCGPVDAWAQRTDSTQLINRRLDSLYIDEVQDQRVPDKVLHAEPMYIDLIRDLGARKGEREAGANR